MNSVKFSMQKASGIVITTSVPLSRRKSTTALLLPSFKEYPG
ncbi:hypothetical protein [Thermoanaerobacter kivui]|nr:hypothetical protein [Thermoanaerobacter kivui]